MCSICRRYVCHPSCPNADEPVPVSIGKCTYCTKDIMSDEEYIDVGDYKYHFDCIDGLPTKELLEIFDVRVKIVEYE